MAQIDIADNAQMANDDLNSLPVELLIAIFTECTMNEALASLATRAVCRRWRDIADSSPALWRRICLDESTFHVHSLHHQAFYYLEKSHPLPVDVELHVHDPDLILPLLSPLLPAISRWQTFTITGYRTEHVSMIDFPVSAMTTSNLSLDRLILTLHDYEEPDDDDDDFDESFLCPRQPTFTPDAAMQLWVSNLPCSDLLAPLHFTHLTITEGPLDLTQTHVTAILDLLRACPTLRVFVFHGWPHDDDPLQQERPPIITLPHLDTLHIKSTCAARHLLSSLSTPQLRTLILAYLNVDFRVQSAGDFGDEGDSDDDAQDFSQSPWSDHATGMGLRSLISRCRPPLHKLEMDYSDMRTKDFRWVFDRLEYLEEFRIVASDMSDKVIGLLKPMFGEGRELSVRLPRLKKLELHHCQRLSGDAIVSSIISRAAFTDSNHDDFSRFLHVAIAGCENVDVQHDNLLARALGKRFRN